MRCYAIHPFFFFLALFSAGFAVDAFWEAKGSCFYPLDETFRDVYATALGVGGTELTCQTHKGLYTWVSADMTRKRGTSTGLGYSTKIALVPLGLGVKYLFPVSFADIYVGAGILGTYMQTKDYDPAVVQTTSKWGVGPIAKLGTFFHINKYVFVDLFADYSYTNIGIDARPGVTTRDADLSGLTFGLGLGLHFGKPD